MKRLTVVLAIILLSLVMAGQAWAVDETADYRVTKTGSGQIVKTPCHPLAIYIKGATAGDNIGVYDYSSTSKSGTTTVVGDIRDLEFEMGIAANNGSTFIDTKGIAFDYGIYIHSSAATTLTTVVFDY